MRSKEYIVLNLPDSEQRETNNDKFIEVSEIAIHYSDMIYARIE